MWVYDGERDGNSAVARWWTSAGADGYCRNSSGVGTWRRCDYEFREWLPDGSRNRIEWNDWRYDAELDSWQLITAPAGRTTT
jgi:hypothetical protein